MGLSLSQRKTRRLKKLRKGSGGAGEQAQEKKIKWGRNPLVLGIVGVLLLALWLGLSLFQIQTTESWALAAPAPGVSGQSWGVIFQALELVTGQLSGAVGKSVAIGWAVEVITLVFGMCLEIAAHGVGRSSKLMQSVFVFGGFALLGFNGFTDYSYGSLPSGTCGQLFFAGLMSFVVVFGLPAGLELILRAKDEFTR